MQVWLANKEKHSMLFLGDGLNFTYDAPGPLKVNPEELTSQQKSQLYFNWKRGVLGVDNEDELKSLYTPPAPQAPVAQIPVVRPAQVQDIDEALKAREMKLKGLLREKIDVIKKEIPTLSSVELQVLLGLERQTKKRQKLLSVIENYIAKKFKSISDVVGPEDVGGKHFNPAAQSLDNSMNVVESDMEEITLIPSDKELAKEDG